MLNPDELAQFSTRTLAHYNRHAETFHIGTCDHDVSQNIQALLRAIPGKPLFTILDFGCGPGRDLQALRKLGHRPIGLDGAEQFVTMARSDTDCEVWQQDFLRLSLPAAHFDGVFANASLFHVPRTELSRVLGALRATLKPGGALFSSNPRGDNQEGWHRDRFGVYHDLESWRRHVTDAGFTEVEHYFRPTGLPREQQPWLATVWRRPTDDDLGIPKNDQQTLSIG